MAIQASLVALSPSDFDYHIRKRAESKLSLVSPIYVSKVYSNNTISLDSNNEYTFSDLNFNFRKNSYQIFYDGENKIFESFWNEEKNSLSIKIFTNIQTNLFFDVAADEYILESSANLCIDSQLTINKLISIKSHALCLVDKLICFGNIGFEIEQACILLSEVKTKNIETKSSYLHLSSNLEAEGEIDLSVQAYQQTENASVSTNNLRLVSEQCEIIGDFEVSNKAFLTANNLYLGKNNFETNFFCDSEYYIHSISATITSNVEIELGNSSAVTQELTNRFIVDGSWLIASNSKFKSNNALIECNLLNNDGDFILHNARMLCNGINNSSVLQSNLTEITLLDSLMTQKNSKITLSASEFKAKEAHVNLGDVFLNDCLWEMDSLNVYDASFHILNKSEVSVIDLNVLSNSPYARQTCGSFLKH